MALYFNRPQRTKQDVARVALAEFRQLKQFTHLGTHHASGQEWYVDEHNREYVTSQRGTLVPRKVQRNLSPYDNPKKGSRGIEASDPDAPVGPAQIAAHVQGPKGGKRAKKRSAYISTTKKSAENLTNAKGEKLGGEYGRVTIDLLEVPPSQIFDLTRAANQTAWGLAGPSTPKERQALQDVIRTQEVLILGPIPPDAIDEVHH
ncbi:hypothetical protein NKH77_40140 [Streptomyces sp. M19]